MAIEDKKSSLFEFLNSISFNKDEPFETLEEKEYNAYMINRFLSFSPDTVMYAQEMNIRYGLPVTMQYDFLKNSIRRKKRFFKYLKKSKEENIDCVKEYFDYSNAKANEVLSMLSDDDIEHIKRRLDKGGAKGGAARKKTP